MASAPPVLSSAGSTAASASLSGSKQQPSRKPLPLRPDSENTANGAYSWKDGPIQVSLKEGRHELSGAAIDKSWFINRDDLLWNASPLVLPIQIDQSFFREIRGQDEPNFEYPSFVRGSMASPPPYKKANCTLVFADKEGDFVQVLGGSTGKVGEEQGQVKFRTSLDSQVPSLSLTIRKRDPETNRVIRYRLRFFGNKSMAGAFFLGPSEFKEAQLEHAPQDHQEAAEDGRLLGVQLSFGKFDAQKPRWLNSVVFMHGEGNDQEGYDRWEDDDDMLKSLQASEPTELDLLIANILQRDDISLSFLRNLNKSSVPWASVFELEYRYWLSNMKASCQHGRFWLFADQPGFNENAPGSYFSGRENPSIKTLVPFWLLRKCMAHVTSRGLAKIEPLEWAPIVSEPELLQ